MAGQPAARGLSRSPDTCSRRDRRLLLTAALLAPNYIAQSI
jgi:hypothetical protein